MRSRIPSLRALSKHCRTVTGRPGGALFEPDAELHDDRSPCSLKEFTHHAFGHERFTSIDRVENSGLDSTGAFHSDQCGDFRIGNETASRRLPSRGPRVQSRPLQPRRTSLPRAD